jgi:hypothetical protein
MNESLMLSQLIAEKRTPALAPRMTHAREQARWVRVNKARAVRNFFVRMPTRTIAAGSPATTISVRTPALAYGYMITAISGGIALAPGLDLRVRFDSSLQRDLSEENVPSPVLIGGCDFWNFNLSSFQEEAIDLPVPIAVEANEQLTIDFIVAANLANDVAPELTLHCLRVYEANSVEAQLPDEWARLVERQIKNYSPRMVYLRTLYDWTNIPADGRFHSDVVRVPLLLLGATSSLVASRIELRDEMNGYEFMPAVGDAGNADPDTKAVPSSVIAPNKNHSKGGIYWFQRPHLLMPGTRLSVLPTNGLEIVSPATDESLFNGAQWPFSRIAWICTTV